jgi:hypothetical protein
LIERYLQLKKGLIQMRNFSPADLTIRQADTKLIPYERAMYSKHVREPAALQPHSIGLLGKIFGKKKNEIQWRLLILPLLSGHAGTPLLGIIISI